MALIIVIVYDMKYIFPVKIIIAFSHNKSFFKAHS